MISRSVHELIMFSAGNLFVDIFYSRNMNSCGCIGNNNTTDNKEHNKQNMKEPIKNIPSERLITFQNPVNDLLNPVNS